ncbi:MAG: hypothetical protein ACON4L_06340 [Flavobacteriaceae bacterium]
MKNQISLAFIAITVLACSNSIESVASMDAKSLKIKSHINAYMNNDSSVAEKLFAEDLELYDQFSNNQKDGETLSNPGGNMGLIEADKFTHVLFSEIKCTTDNIKTYTDTNGDVYTVFWSMWSGKGNFTGAKTTIPFHCVSLWEGDKISKVWRYMDPSALQKEIDAFEGFNNSSTKVMGLADLKVNDGFTKNEVKEFMKNFTKFVRETEPNTYDFGYFISADGQHVNLVEKYYDSADFVHHLNNFESSKFAEKFMTIFSLERVLVVGNSSDALKAKVKGYGAELRENIGGWID